MKRFISYPHIGQYRNIVSNVRNMATYVGQDENDEAIYDNNLKLPEIKFRGTVKLHGTNSGIVYNAVDGIWAQSRKNIITPEKDNAGFAFFVDTHKEAIQKLFDTIIERENIDTKEKNISIFGEWCCGNIQKGVALSGLSKRLVIFGVKISPFEQNEDKTQEEVSVWADHTNLSDNENDIYNIEDFKTFEIDIDFNRPDIAQNKFVELVDEVEKECPVGKAFGRKLGEDCTIGEGLVWKGWFKGNQLMFKTKGEKHSSSRVKTVAPVDTEKMNSIHEFVDYAVTENRLNQGIEQVFTITSEIPVIQKMGDYIRWVVSDIVREEADTLSENGLEPKEVNKFISMKARTFFQKYLDEQAGL